MKNCVTKYESIAAIVMDFIVTQKSMHFIIQTNILNKTIFHSINVLSNQV